MNGLNIVEARKIPRVECQDMFDAVNMHRGYQPSVMDLDAGDAVSDKNPSPFVVHGSIIRQEPELGFD